MSDTILILLAVVFVAGIIASVFVWFRRHQLEVRKVEATELAEKRRKELEVRKRTEEGVAAGTLTESGKLKCIISGCEREACHDRAHIVQDELSFRSWVRRRLP